MSRHDQPTTRSVPTPRPAVASRPGRRAVLAGAAGAAALAVGAPTAATARTPRRDPRVLRSARRGLDFLGRMTAAYDDVTGGGPVLAQSYSDQNGLFATAFVYDQALAVCAALAAGRPGEAVARRLGDGLLFAQDNDPVHDDGRLRQAYNVGPYTFYDGSRNEHGLRLPDGTANVGYQFGFLGTAVGDMAWPGMALAQLAERTGEARYLAGALRIGRWITTNARNGGALGGFSFGVDAAGNRVPNVSTEHNVDCVGFFGQLAAATGDAAWAREADEARALVERTWEPAGGYFYTGSNDGSTLNRDPLPLDPQTWSWLALQDRRFAGALDWAASALAVVDDAAQPRSALPDGLRVGGVTFSSASLTSTAVYDGREVNPQGVWCEGTAQLATSLVDRAGRRATGRADEERAAALLQEMRRAQEGVGQGQTVGGRPLPAASGLVAATSPIDTGFGFGYFPSQHVGATAWYVMAVEGANPFRRTGLR